MCPKISKCKLWAQAVLKSTAEKNARKMLHSACSDHSKKTEGEKKIHIAEAVFKKYYNNLHIFIVGDF